MTVITEVKRIKVNHDCIDNPFTIRFSNAVGGYDYRTFKTRQTISYNVKNVKEQKKYVEDWYTDKSINEIVQKTVRKKMKLGADNLTLAEAEGLKYLLSSCKLEYEFDSINNIWHTVTLEDGDFEIIDTAEDVFVLEFEILFPETQIVVQ